MAELKKNLPIINIRGILSDIDGPLYFKESPIKRAIDAVYNLQKRRKYYF